MVMRHVRQKGIISSSCGLTVFLFTVVVIAATTDLAVFVPSTIQNVIVAALAGQLVGWVCSGRRENR